MRVSFPNFLRIFLPLIAATASLGSTLAAIRPSFSLDDSAWRATNIVLVEVTSEDGVFSVVESWKGDLQPGARITVPELTPGSDAKPISLYPKQTDAFPVEDGISENIPRQPSGSRMILFLEKEESSDTSAGSESRSSGEKWRSADYTGNLKGSTVWIEGNQAHGFQQFMNPGPSVLSILRFSVEEMKDRVKTINPIQERFAQVVKIDDGAARAVGLKPYVRSDLYQARRFALNELGKCGPSAVGTIRGMLDDRAFFDEADELIRALVEAGGETVGEELNTRLRRDLEFWQATAPSLSEGWWNEDTTPHSPLRRRYERTIQLILGLEQTHYAPAQVAATELGNLWRSLPQLNDPSGLNQVADACDRLTAHLRAQ
jgi:hypothetical protein